MIDNLVFCAFVAAIILFAVKGRKPPGGYA